MKLTTVDYYIFTHTWYHRPSLNFLARFSMMTLGKSKENNDLLVFAILISQVLKSYTKKPVYYKIQWIYIGFG